MQCPHIDQTTLAIRTSSLTQSGSRESDFFSLHLVDNSRPAAVDRHVVLMAHNAFVCVCCVCIVVIIRMRL